jgi:predicted house-cleaning noncanonical NTP pyrophosphatase (MazG superfamily)
MVRERLGGDNQTLGELNERVRRVLAPLPTVDLGWPWQCRCGGTRWVRYRARFYCPADCRRMQNPDAHLPGRAETFRQAFERASGNPAATQPQAAAITPPSAASARRVCEDCGGPIESDVEGRICRGCRRASLRDGEPKLVRDRVPELMGGDWRGHIAEDAEYLSALGRKLAEEADEAAECVYADEQDRDKLLEELGDVVEVVYALAAVVGAIPAEVEQRRLAKRQRRGGFERRLIWEGGAS